MTTVLIAVILGLVIANAAQAYLIQNTSKLMGKLLKKNDEMVEYINTFLEISKDICKALDMAGIPGPHITIDSHIDKPTQE